MTADPRPVLSVIVPAHAGAEVLPRSLGALLASDLPREQWELIVVDDASADATSEVAHRYADRVVRLLGTPSGPAFARNRGCEAARGDVLVFVDADVCVRADTLRRFAEVFAQEPGVDAVFGAYDAAPEAAGVVSQYRNLLHHYVHMRNAGDAATFWAGCGAVRKNAFARAGGFDAEAYPRPQVEDIELGYRLRAAGSRIVLRPDIQATHLKGWTLPSMVLTDLRDRGVPWMRLLLRQRSTIAFGDLNVRAREKVFTVLTALAVFALLGGLVGQSTLMVLTACACILPVVVGNAPLLGWFARVRGVGFALGVVPLRLLYYLLNGVAVAIATLQHYATTGGRQAIRTPRHVGEPTGPLLGLEPAARELSTPRRAP